MLVELVRADVVRSAALAASSSGTCGALVWIGILLWIVPALGAGWQLVRANQDYLRLYREQVSPTVPTLEDLYERSLGAPWVWWMGAFSLSWRIRQEQRRPGATPAIEATRRRVLFWRKVTVALVFGGILFPILICLLSGG